MRVRRAFQLADVPVEGNEVVGQESVERINLRVQRVNAAIEPPPDCAQTAQDNHERSNFSPVHVSRIHQCGTWVKSTVGAGRGNPPRPPSTSSGQASTSSGQASREGTGMWALLPWECGLPARKGKDRQARCLRSQGKEGNRHPEPTPAASAAPLPRGDGRRSGQDARAPRGGRKGAFLSPPGRGGPKGRGGFLRRPAVRPTPPLRGTPPERGWFGQKKRQGPKPVPSCVWVG